MNDERSELVRSLFPGGVPLLWCPPLTHFTESGEIDEERMEAHLRFLVQGVSSFLLPGTTGEGWELSDAESQRLLRFALRRSDEIGYRFLVGILKATAAEMVETIREFLRALEIPAGTPDTVQALGRRGVTGFTVCAPAGGQLGQREIAAALREVLSLGLPTALYQLPQVTGNEIAPETAAALAGEFPNLFLIKDSSGADRLASSGALPDGLFLVRGAEGRYFEHQRANGGDYDGFLLSTANCFAQELAAIVDPSTPQKRRRELSATLTAIVEEGFAAVNELRIGNAFTNLNKAIDHFNAYGARAERAPAPRLHGGSALPSRVVDRIGEILERHGQRRDRGYLDAQRHPE